MMADVLTMMWKELTELRRATFKISSIFGVLMWIALFGVSPALLLGPASVRSPLTIAYWVALPVIIGAGMAINAFAGERENHTLETLLATRLSDQAILFGKVAAGVVYSLLYVVTAMIAGLITTNLATAAVAAHGDGRLLMYSPVVGLGGLAVALLAAGVASAAGVLASLRAATVRAAGQKLILMYLALAIPYFIIGFLPGDTRAGVIEKVSGTNSAVIVLVAAVVLVALNVGLNAAAISRFQRSQLILD